MTDLDMTKLCAEAMGYQCIDGLWWDENRFGPGRYNPLHDDAQAMALVKKLHLHIDQRPSKACSAQDPCFTIISERKDCDLNRAIVECVARMQANKQGVHYPDITSVPNSSER